MIDTTTDFAEMQADGSWLRAQSCKAKRPAESEIMKYELSGFRKQDDKQIAVAQRNHEDQKEEQIDSNSKRQPEQETPVPAAANTATDAQGPVDQRSTSEQIVQPTTEHRNNSTTSQSSLLRKEPNHEFFQMCLLSFKMNNQDLDEVVELDPKALYTKCIE